MIQIEDLCFRYKKHVRLLDGLSLSMASGCVYGLLGLNGAGKTTLLKIMAGMLFPKSGTCRVMGYDSSERKPAMLADMMFVPEEFYAPSLTICQYVDLYAPFYPQFDHEQFDKYMDELQLKKNQWFNSLSMGQKKKAVLGFALAANTRVLILDEPTNGLDIPSKTQFRRMVASAATDDRCIIISTHQVLDIDKLIDAVIVLDNGKIALNQTVENITGKLAFRTIAELTGQELYSEESVAGYRSIIPNAAGETTQVDLELLFNALISNGQSVQNIFNR